MKFSRRALIALPLLTAPVLASCGGSEDTGQPVTAGSAEPGAFPATVE